MRGDGATPGGGHGAWWPRAVSGRFAGAVLMGALLASGAAPAAAQGAAQGLRAAADDSVREARLALRVRAAWDSVRALPPARAEALTAAALAGLDSAVARRGPRGHWTYWRGTLALQLTALRLSAGVDDGTCGGARRAAAAWATFREAAAAEPRLARCGDCPDPDGHAASVRALGAAVDSLGRARCR